MLYANSLFPIVIYLIILKLLDGFKMVRWTVLIACLACGALSCTMAASMAWNNGDATPWMPIIEEMLKASFIVALVARRRIVFFAEAMVYGAAVGSGFALLENSIYVYFNPDMLLATAMFRGIATSMLHMGCTAIFAVTMLLSRIWGAKSWPLCAIAPLTDIIIPVAIHYTYNLHVLPEMIQLVLTVVLFLFLFIGISEYNERRIYQWMDHSISYDIQLLSAIKQGQLTETKAGQYLISIRNQFDAEVFFDMVCFMQLYLELVVEGKSRMLLEQAGLATPLTPGQQRVHQAKVTELHTLRRNIGRMGEHILRPIITIRDTDLRII